MATMKFQQREALREGTRGREMIRAMFGMMDLNLP